MLDSPKAISPFWFISTYHLWRPSQAGCSGQQQRQRKRAWQLWKKAITHIIATIYIRVSHSVMSKSLWSHWLWPSRFLCLWNSAGKNTGVGSHSLLQRIFQIQGSNPDLLHCRKILYHISSQESPSKNFNLKIKLKKNGMQQLQSKREVYSNTSSKKNLK